MVKKELLQRLSKIQLDFYDGFNTTSYGFVAGLDKNLTDSSIIGISTSYINTNATQNIHKTDTNTIGFKSLWNSTV